MRKRTGLTMVEVLVVLAIIAILVALTLPAVQHVRSRALGMQVHNRLRQVILAAHQYAAAHGDRIPFENPSKGGFLWDLFPYLEVREYYEKTSSGGELLVRMTVLQSPTDPTLDLLDPNGFPDAVSLAFNQSGVRNGVTLQGSFRDGLTHTLALGEHYHSTTKRSNVIVYTPQPGASAFAASVQWAGLRSASFADESWHDVLPVVEAGRPTRPSVPGVTFQLVPKPEQSDGRLLQATQSGGLKVAMFDGSVRTIAPSVSEVVFWGMVTPTGGEPGE